MKRRISLNNTDKWLTLNQAAKLSKEYLGNEKGLSVATLRFYQYRKDRYHLPFQKYVVFTRLHDNGRYMILIRKDKYKHWIKNIYPLNQGKVGKPPKTKTGVKNNANGTRP